MESSLYIFFFMLRGVCILFCEIFAYPRFIKILSYIFYKFNSDSVLNLFLQLVLDVWVKVHYFQYGYPVDPAPFIEKTVPSSQNWNITFALSWVDSVCVCVRARIHKQFKSV